MTLRPYHDGARVARPRARGLGHAGPAVDRRAPGWRDHTRGDACARREPHRGRRGQLPAVAEVAFRVRRHASERAQRATFRPAREPDRGVSDRPAALRDRAADDVPVRAPGVARCERHDVWEPDECRRADTRGVVDDRAARRVRIDRMEPWPFRARCPVVVGEWSAPTHLSWVAGFGPGRATYGGRRPCTTLRRR